MAAATTSGVEAEVAALAGLNIDQMRTLWRGRFGPPPPLRSADFMRRCFAERVQIAAYGQDREVERELDRLVRAHARGASLKREPPKVTEGAVFIREYEGRTYRVEKRPDGYAWDGRMWRSLSEVAREITGVRWNGPRFFGLRAGAKA